jgi:hypothetical protein
MKRVLDKILDLVMDDWFISLLSIFFSGYLFALSLISMNNFDYVQSAISAVFSIMSFTSAYILWKRNTAIEDEAQHKHKKVVKVK